MTPSVKTAIASIVEAAQQVEDSTDAGDMETVFDARDAMRGAAFELADLFDGEKETRTAEEVLALADSWIYATGPMSIALQQISLNMHVVDVELYDHIADHVEQAFDDPHLAETILLRLVLDYGKALEKLGRAGLL